MTLLQYKVRLMYSELYQIVVDRDSCCQMLSNPNIMIYTNTIKTMSLGYYSMSLGYYSNAYCNSNESENVNNLLN